MGSIAWRVALFMSLAFAGACPPLQAALPERIRAQVETSMLVSGYVGIATDGTTSGVQLDQRDALPPGIVKLVERAAGTWRFEPVRVDGVVSAVRTRMQLRVVAKQTGEDAYTISLRGATFGGQDGTAPSEVRATVMTPPRYPKRALRMGMQGEVYLVVRVGRDGRVQDALSEQVNLFVYGRPAEMDAGRKLLSDAALLAARDWTFQPPSEGPAVDAPYWSVRIPVAFMFADSPRTVPPGVGEWKTYLPGPRTSAPWADAGEGNEGSDAIAEGRLQMAGVGPRLLTPLEG